MAWRITVEAIEVDKQPTVSVLGEEEAAPPPVAATGGGAAAALIVAAILAVVAWRRSGATIAMAAPSMADPEMTKPTQDL